MLNKMQAWLHDCKRDMLEGDNVSVNMHVTSFIKRLKINGEVCNSGGHFAKYWGGGGGGGGEIFSMYAFGVGLRYANLSNIMIIISSVYNKFCLLISCFAVKN